MIITQKYQAMSTTTYGNSRKARFEEKKVLKQTIILVIVAVILCLLCIFVIIPGAIKFIGGTAAKDIAAVGTTTPVLLTPFLNAPSPATSSANIKISGFSQKGNTLIITDNDQEIKRVDAADDGSFKADVTLHDGMNSISVYASTGPDKKSLATATYPVLFDKNPPKLDISEPTDAQNIQGRKNQSMTIKGQSDKDVKIFVNDRLVLTRNDGSFSTAFYLSSGANALDIKAVNQAGNTTEKKLTVNFSE